MVARKRKAQDSKKKSNNNLEDSLAKTSRPKKKKKSQKMAKSCCKYVLLFCMFVAASGTILYLTNENAHDFVSGTAFHFWRIITSDISKQLRGKVDILGSQLSICMVAIGDSKLIEHGKNGIFQFVQNMDISAEMINRDEFQGETYTEEVDSSPASEESDNRDIPLDSQMSNKKQPQMIFEDIHGHATESKEEFVPKKQETLKNANIVQSRDIHGDQNEMQQESIPKKQKEESAARKQKQDEKTKEEPATRMQKQDEKRKEESAAKTQKQDEKRKEEPAARTQKQDEKRKEESAAKTQKQDEKWKEEPAARMQKQDEKRKEEPAARMQKQDEKQKEEPAARTQKQDEKQKEEPAARTQKQDEKRKGEPAARMQKQDEKRKEEPAARMQKQNEKQKEEPAARMQKQDEKRKGEPAARMQKQDEKRKGEPAARMQKQDEKRKGEPAVRMQKQDEKRKEEPAARTQKQDEKRKEEPAARTQKQDEKRKEEPAARTQKQDEKRKEEPAARTQKDEKRKEEPAAQMQKQDEKRNEEPAARMQKQDEKRKEEPAAKTQKQDKKRKGEPTTTMQKQDEKRKEESAAQMQKQDEKRKEEPAARMQKQDEKRKEEPAARMQKQDEKRKEEPAARTQKQDEKRKEEPAAKTQKQDEKRKEEPAARTQKQDEKRKEESAAKTQKQDEKRKEEPAARMQREEILTVGKIKGESQKAGYETITSLADQKILRELDGADSQLEKGKIEEALSSYSHLLEKYPKSPRATYGRALALDQKAKRFQSNKLLEQCIHTLEVLLSYSDVPNDLLLMAGRKLANRQQFRGWVVKAKNTLKFLVEHFPQNIRLKNEFGTSCLIGGYNEEARQAFKDVLKVVPNDGYAKVHLGFILKTIDKNPVKAISYLREGIATSDEGTADGRFYFHLGDALQRVGRNSEAYVFYKEGADKGLFLSAYQRSLYNIERLTSRPWWTQEETTYQRYFKILEDNWEVIRNEGLAQMHQTHENFVPEEENLRETGDWKQFTLYQQGRQNLGNCKKVPRTCALIEQIHEAKYCKRGQVKFSVMQPGVHVWPHCGPTNCRIRAHLGLVVPPGPRIRVVNETREWKEGQVIIFDDSFEHEIWHTGSKFRLVLIVDFWHPELSAEEKAHLTPI